MVDVREEALKNFHRTALVTQAIMAAAIEINNAFPDREEIPMSVMVLRVRQLTGIRFSDEYIVNAVNLFEQTGRVVEAYQLHENLTEH